MRSSRKNTVFWLDSDTLKFWVRFNYCPIYLELEHYIFYSNNHISVYIFLIEIKFIFFSFQNKNFKHWNLKLMKKYVGIAGSQYNLFYHFYEYYFFQTPDEYLNFLNTFVFQTEAPSSPPQNVRARPVSAGTVVVHWDEPKVPNGVILVSV